MMLGAAAASGEMLRFVDCVAAAAPLASSSSSTSSGATVRAGRHCGGGESGWPRKAVSVKQKKKNARMCSCTSTSGAIRISAASERAHVVAQVSLSSSTAAPAPVPAAFACASPATRNRRREGGVRALRAAAQASVATIETEELEYSDATLDEAFAHARAAAEAARDAARNAAAFAEAQAMADLDGDSELAFPSEQDLLLLERARLTEMARTGSVQVTTRPAETVEDVRAPNQWTEREYSTPDSAAADSDSGVIQLEPKQRLCELENGEQTASDEVVQDDDGAVSDDDESVRRRRGDITVRSSRRKERVLKRERALLRADMNAASAPIPGLSKAKKPLANYDASDPVRAYLRDISKTKLLTAAEEVGLAEGIQDLLRMESVKANLTEQMGREPTLLEWARAVGSEHQSLESRVKSGQACKDKMVNSNLRLVVSIAKRYQGRGMTIQDLIQEGSMGLIRGAEKFDHTRGFKFSTYAHWWIRQAITRAIADQSRTIRLPVHVYELLSRINKAKSILAAEHGRMARDEEVAELVGLNIEKLKLVMKSAKNPKSLEFPIGRNNDTMLGEVIPDKDFESPEEAITKRLLKQDLNAVLNTLNPRERDVLKLRYGLDDGRMRTLEEIGNVFHVTRERIRQIEAKALRKLRQPSRNTALREYLDLKV